MNVSMFNDDMQITCTIKENKQYYVIQINNEIDNLTIFTNNVYSIIGIRDSINNFLINR